MTTHLHHFTYKQIGLWIYYYYSHYTFFYHGLVQCFTTDIDHLACEKNVNLEHGYATYEIQRNALSVPTRLVATLHCSHGFELVGKKQLTCEFAGGIFNSGRWIIYESQCQGKNINVSYILQNFFI